MAEVLEAARMLAHVLMLHHLAPTKPRRQGYIRYWRNLAGCHSTLPAQHVREHFACLIRLCMIREVGLLCKRHPMDRCPIFYTTGVQPKRWVTDAMVIVHTVERLLGSLSAGTWHKELKALSAVALVICTEAQTCQTVIQLRHSG